MRPKLWPDKDENRSACWVLMLATPLSSKLKRAKRRACGLTSVAVTSTECKLACNAWTPLPVPTSRVRPTSPRTVILASIAELAPTPIT